MRITSDCPFTDPDVIDKVIKTYLDSECDYVSNTIRYTYPDGLDVEVFSKNALEVTWREAKTQVEREHVTPYLRTSGHFSVKNVENEHDLSKRNLRWTVDEPADIEFVRSILNRLQSNDCLDFRMKDILKLLNDHPEILNLKLGR